MPKLKLSEEERIAKKREAARKWSERKRAEKKLAKELEVPQPKEEKPNGQSPKDEKVFHLTESELNKVITAVVDKKLKDIVPAKETKNETEVYLKEVLETLRDSAYPGAVRGMVRDVSEIEIDPEDVMKQPATFFCYSFYKSIWGDRKWGHSTRTPFGSPIIFKHLYRYTRPGNSRYDNHTVTMSVATIISKKEADWLRGHSLFGIQFFESIDGAQTVNSQLAERLMDTNSMLSNMTQHEVIKRAEMEGLRLSTDIDDVRRRLCYYLAEKDLKKGGLKIGIPKPIDPSWTPNRIEEVLIKTE